MSGRSAEESSQLIVTVEVTEDCLHPNSQGIPDHVSHIGVRASGVSSVRTTP